MEIFAVSLVFLLIFQWLQASRATPQRTTKEPLKLVTATEATPSDNRITLLVEGEDEQAPLPHLTAVTVYSADLHPLEPETVPTGVEAEETSPATASTGLDVETGGDGELAAALAIAPTEPMPADVSPTEPVPAAKRRSQAAANRKEEVFNLLDQATAEGRTSYSALSAYVKEKSGQGTSKTTVLAWKKARAGEAVCG